MKRLFLVCLALLAMPLVAQEVGTIEKVVDYLAGALPWVQTIFIWLGGGVVAGTIIDAIVPDKYDKGFMSYVLKIPVLGQVLTVLKKFSPFHAEAKKK